MMLHIGGLSGAGASYRTTTRMVGDWWKYGSQESLISTGLCERVQEILDGRYSTEQIRVFELHMKDHTLTATITQ